MRPLLLAFGVVLLLAAIFGPQQSWFPNLVVAGPGGPATVGNLVGYVTDTSTSSGIVGASVVLSVYGTTKFSTSTVAAGYYKFGAITAGGYTITVGATGYSTFQGSTGVSPGTTSTYSVQIAPLPLSGGSGGVSSGSGCTPTPSGTCSVPPPPPGVQAPPPPTGNATATNATVSWIPGSPKVLPVVLGFLGFVFIAVGLVARRLS